jgi:hypothetical protein
VSLDKSNSKGGSIMSSILGYGLAIIVAIISGAVVWAWSLPEEATATRTATIAAPVDLVFARVTAVGDQAAWRSDVGEVRVEAGGTDWTEITKAGIAISFEQVERLPPQRYVIRFSSPQGFEGEWVGTFEPRGADTYVTFTERVRTPGLVGRALARLFAPPGAHIERYLADLAKSLEKQ